MEPGWSKATVCVFLTSLICTPVMTQERNQNHHSLTFPASSPTNDSVKDLDVYPVSSGSCVFNNTLCSYVQGSVDDSMTSWTTHWDYSFAHGAHHDCSHGSSVLMSPLLNFSVVSCFEIGYSVFLPANLDAFIQFNDPDQRQYSLFPVWKDGTAAAPAITHTVPSYPLHAAGQVKIRAQCGSTDQGNVELHYVSLEEGQCELQPCDFNSNCDAGWTLDGWETASRLGQRRTPVTDADSVSGGKFVHVNRARRIAAMTSNWTGAPSAGYVCLCFKFILRGRGAQLQVDIELRHGNSATVWRTIESSSVRRWVKGRIPVSVSNVYRIVFRGELIDRSSRTVALDSITVVKDVEEECSFHPEGSNTQATFPAPFSTTTITTQSAVPLHPSLSEEATTTSSHRHDPANLNSSSETTKVTSTGEIHQTPPNDEKSTASAVVTESLSGREQGTRGISSRFPSSSRTTTFTPVESVSAERPRFGSTGHSPTADFTVHPVPSGTDPTHGMSSSKDHDGDVAPDVAFIAGAVGGVLVIAAVVVLVVIVWRRRALRRKPSKNTEMKSMSSLEPGNTYPNSVTTASHNEHDYINIDVVTSAPLESNVRSDKAAADTVPGRPRTSVSDYSHLTRLGIDKTAEMTSKNKTEGNVAGNYSQVEIDDDYSLAMHAVCGASSVPLTGGSKTNQRTQADAYSTVTKPAHKPTAACPRGQEKGDYDTVTHHRQKFDSAGKGRDAAADPYNVPGSYRVDETCAHGTNRKDNHSKASKPDHKPAASLRPGCQEDDYSTITHNRQKQAEMEEGRDATTNPYNLPQSYSTAAPFGSAVSAGEERETTDAEGDYSTVDDDWSHPVSPSKEMDSSSDCYFILEPDPTTGDAGESGGPTNHTKFNEDEDKYNTLNFDEGRKPPSELDDVTHNTYDHVRVDRDDDYSTAQIGKRNVVIDSDYDHIKR